MSSSVEHRLGLHEFYKDKTILLTGSTGFLGTILVEKLLRSFPEIKQLILIVRGKCGKSSKERMENYFGGEIFDRVRDENPSALSKVISLEGDVSMDNCGLQLEDIEIIHREVDLVIHGAAIIKFNEFLKSSVNTNVRGTHNLLELCKGIKNLEGFVHVSTTYINSHNTITEEKIYPHSIAPEKLIDLVNALDDETIKNISPAILGKWSHSYMFTKNAAENLVYSYRHHMPVTIFRPATIAAPYKEPIPAWVTKNIGPYPLFAKAALGLNRILCVGDANSNSNIVPCDYVAQAIIATLWDTGIQREKSSGAIVNYSSTGNPISWNEIMGKVLLHLEEAPFANCRWYPMIFMEPSLLRYRIYRFFLQRLPAYLSDFCSLLLNQERTSVKSDIKLSKALEEIIPYLNKLEFQMENIYTILNKLSEEDKNELNFDVRLIRWDDYCKQIPMGMKKYLIKDPMTKEAIQIAKIKYFWLYVLDRVVKTGLLIIMLYCLYGCIFWIFF